MKITSITTQQKSKERYNIFLDEKYAFSVDEEVLARFRLAKGKDVTETEVEKIIAADEVRKALNKAIHFLSIRVRSEKEIHDFLAKQNYNQNVIKETLAKLSAMDYLDDQEFATLYVRTQVKTTLKGPRNIERELIAKGITGDIISATMTYYTVAKQLENATKQSAKIARRNNKSARKNVMTKITTDLLAKGYSMEVANEAALTATENMTLDTEEAILGEQLTKLIRKNKRFEPIKAKQKTIQSLMQKGFNYDKIQSYLNEHEISFLEDDVE